MGGGLLSEALLFAPDRATLMALLAVLPVALALYLNCRSRAGRLRTAFSLGKLEAIESERAMLLYKKAARRRQEIDRQREPARGSWRESRELCACKWVRFWLPAPHHMP